MESERTVMEMAEYIEREAISEKIRKYYYKNPPNSSYEEGFDRGLDRAQRAILDAPTADVAPVRRWIPVAERLPEKNKEVVGWYKDNPFSPFRYGIVSWNGHGWVFTYAQRYVDAVTYWMPLPEPPKEETP